MPSNFSLLLDELHAEDTARQRGTLQKAGDAWPGQFMRPRRRVNPVADLAPVLRELDRLTQRAHGMLKATPAPAAVSPREAFASAYSRFSAMVAAGQFAPADALRLDARLLNIGARL